LKRRRFVLSVVGTVAAFGLGWSVMPVRQRMRGKHAPRTGPGEHALNGWVTIAADDTITVIMSKSEMGQGVHTTLAMILADELDADWQRVRIAMAPIDHIYGNIATMTGGLPFHPDDRGVMQRTVAWMTAKTMREAGMMLTGGSSSIKDLWLPMRQAGASARAMLVAAAAARWTVAASDLMVENGVVSHATSRRSARFGALIADAAALPMNDSAPLKTPAQFRLIGTAVPRLEGSAKARGAATFGIDVRTDGMLYAAMVMCPTRGGAVAVFDPAPVLALPGVKFAAPIAGYHGGTGGVAVVADTAWHAMRAAKAATVTWNHGPCATFNSADAMRQLTAALDDDAHAYFARGDVSAALASGATTVTAEYSAPYLAHAAMEPINCTAQFTDGRATVWASTQVPDLARHVAARVLGISDDAVDVKVQFLGGGFGRRLDVDFIAQAAQVASVTAPAPVQVLWTREDDLRHDFYRPACVARFDGALDAQGALTAWRNTSASQSVVNAMLSRLFGMPNAPIDKTTSEGAFDQPYEFPAARIAHRIVALPIPVGFWRSVGHSHQAFFVECFMDEMATAAQRDPVAFRLALLRRHPRHARVLQRAAEIAGWGARTAAPTSDGARTGRGVALHESFGSVVAQVADVTVAADNSVRVTRVHCVIDCGFPVNPDVIRQQMESGIIFGLSAALHGEITIENGQVAQGNFDGYRPLRMQECPEIIVDIIPSTAHPEGVGEPAVPPIAPAVANAIFAATGQRLRSLPLRLAAVSRA
jgi:isoquinoline 1-oxidoreductase subunit beta